MPKRNQQTDELEAFCQFCPVLQEVITSLKHMGIRLEFQMNRILPPAYSHLAQLPAHFHFEGQAVLYHLRPFPGKPHRKRAQMIQNSGYLLILQMRDNVWNGSDLPGRYGDGRQGANASEHERNAQMPSTPRHLPGFLLKSYL